MANDYIKNLTAALYQSQDGKTTAEIKKIVERAFVLLRKKRLLSKAPQLLALLEARNLAAEGKIRVDVVSRTPLSASMLKEIRDYVHAKFKKEPELHETTGPTILGGFKIIVEDTVLDATVNRQLKNLSKHLTNV